MRALNAGGPAPAGMAGNDGNRLGAGNPRRNTEKILMSKQNKKCPACDLEAAAMGPLAAFVLGATFGRLAVGEDASVSSMCCDPHRQEIVRSQFAAIAALRRTSPP